jgi:hypothetical protein
MVRIPQPPVRKSMNVASNSSLPAEADHHAALGRNAGRVAPRPIEQLQRSRVASARARHPAQPRHRFSVVVEHVGPRVEHGVQRRLVALEIR